MGSARFLILSALAAALAGAQDRLDPHPLNYVTAAGRGGAFLAVPGMPSSFVHNPAHLGRLKGIDFSLEVGAKVDHEVYDLVQYFNENADQFDTSNTTEASRISFADEAVRNFHQRWFGFTLPQTNASLHLFGLGAFLRFTPFGEFMMDRGLIFPYARAHYGAYAEAGVGYGLSVTERADIGVLLKTARQLTQKKTMESTQLRNLEPTTQELEDPEIRHGVGMDIGVLHTTGETARMAFVLRNLGMDIVGHDGPEFSAGYSQIVRERPDRDLHPLGEIDIAIDFCDIFGPAPLLSKLKVGGEMELNVLPVRLLQLALRAGLDGGYPSGGVGLILVRYLRLDYATSATELGEYAGQEGRRYHMLSGKISFGF